MAETTPGITVIGVNYLNDGNRTVVAVTEQLEGASVTVRDAIANEARTNTQLHIEKQRWLGALIIPGVGSRTTGLYEPRFRQAQALLDRLTKTHEIRNERAATFFLFQSTAADTAPLARSGPAAARSIGEHVLTIVEATSFDGNSPNYILVRPGERAIIGKGPGSAFNDLFADEPDMVGDEHVRISVGRENHAVTVADLGFSHSIFMHAPKRV